MRTNKLKSIFRSAPDAVRRAARDYAEGHIKPGMLLVALKNDDGSKVDPGLADEQYVLATGLPWVSSKGLGPKKGYPDIGVLVVRKPKETGPSKGRCVVAVTRYEQLVDRYRADSRREGELPEWFTPEALTEQSRRRLWDHAREVFGRLYPGETLTQESKKPRQKKIDFPGEVEEKSTPRVAARKPPEGEITVQANGVTVTGTREAIRALLFGEE